ncbi:hypothetical protein [Sulfitobacter sabulilitoris]|uniref:Uncharacterized protein n=1 Tax=Sulfitobacter sabulilitoris TaxID=2562655 RepID=A0A5S3PIS3_9RHOB|nr:hypothetical protein [Sulfitobacter sabulilitoris]TMM51885.1 hypothetical protein FDT80_14205 [Sulfitobacter sabulilitoris]
MQIDPQQLAILTVILRGLRCIATASPGFTARWFAGAITARTLGEAPMMALTAKDRLQNRRAQDLTGRGWPRRSTCCARPTLLSMRHLPAWPGA